MKLVYIFSETFNILSQFHMNKNVKRKCRMLVDYVKTREVVLDEWVWCLCK